MLASTITLTHIGFSNLRKEFSFRFFIFLFKNKADPRNSVIITIINCSEFLFQLKNYQIIELQ